LSALSKEIPPQEYASLGVKKIVQFDGVYEVDSLKNCKPRPIKYEKPLIVVRQMETMASYAKGKLDVTEQIAQKLVSIGSVMFIPRYDRQPRPGLVVPQKFADSVSLTATADLVISVGGTISREAALQGTPSIVISTFGASYVNNYLSKLEFPLFTVDPSQILKLAKKHIGKKWDVKEQLKKLENPVDSIEKIVQKKL